MKWSELPLNPSPRTLRQFAALWILVFGSLAIWHGLFRQRPAAAIVLAGLSLTIGPLGLWRPSLVRPIYVAWLVAAFPIGWAVSHVSLAAVYYLIVTPLGLVSRLAGRDRLSLRRRYNEDTNWIPLGESPGARQYFRQY